MEPKKIRILIGIPSAGHIELGCIESVHNMTVPDGVETELKFFYGYRLDKVRSDIVDYANQENFNGILFVDSDMILPKDTLEKLMAYNKDIITGVYIKKDDNNEVTIYKRKEETVGQPVNNYSFRTITKEEMTNIPSNIIEINACGFGCILVKMSVFKKLTKPYFDFNFTPGYDRISEDFYFCSKAEESKIKIYAALNIQAGHIGRKEFYYKPKG